ncbi:hypothetical protein [Nonomuraea dietziae]|uniref:hypothetical protein n=1 Tax=Nonomuraea dietziae TaxID=65515 RepID=UPI0031E0139A
MAWDLRSNLLRRDLQGAGGHQAAEGARGPALSRYPFDRNPSIVTGGTVSDQRFDQKAQPRLGEDAAANPHQVRPRR